NVWTGGKSDDVNGWVWWSEGHRSDIDWTKLSVTGFDPTIGACIVLSNQASEMLNTDCDAFHPFLCQRETGFRISENDWFQVNDRKLARVAKGSNWESASLICQANGGTLASIYDITEISTIQRELEVKGVPYPQQLWLGGLYDETQMTWIWQDENLPIDGSLWLSGYGGEPDQLPDNACVMMYADSFRNDMCANEYSALCQIFSAGVTNLM
ncbi:uncharacterized protein LOC132753640, partial [Ruditapes philippinarum]|uniref:uncharacterized protein LOC132753640 n=1 Tax=Ruditapes philippinarum TaxID=129788 RepID=UPI00295B9DAA